MLTTMPTAVSTDAALASGLRLAVMRLARRLRSERADNALTLTQLAALATVDRHGSLTPGELAAHERVQPPSMTRVIASLEGLGLLERAPHPSDRRQVLVSMSKAGRSLLREDRRRRDAWLSQRLRELPADDVATLRSAVEILQGLAES